MGFERGPEAARERPKAELEIVLSPELEGQENPGITAALDFIKALDASINAPQPYRGPERASPEVKYLHHGWHEHSEAEKAYRSAAKAKAYVRAVVNPSGNYCQVLVRFFDENGKRLSHQVAALFTAKGEYGGNGFGYLPSDYESPEA